MAEKFEHGDFVQVEHVVCDLDCNGDHIIYWRNALYVKKEKFGHVIIYANGEIHALEESAPIRKATYDNLQH